MEKRYYAGMVIGGLCFFTIWLIPLGIAIIAYTMIKKWNDSPKTIKNWEVPELVQKPIDKFKQKLNKNKWEKNYDEPENYI